MKQADRAARPQPFPQAAREALAGAQMRANVLHATTTIRAKRALAVEEVPDWEDLRDAGAEIKDHALLSLERLLVDFEAAVSSRGGVVHWARDAAEANAVVTEIVRAEGVDEIVKVKSLTTDEIGLNDALEAAGIHALETDLAELIVQLAGERPSHLLVPAIHKNRTEIRDLFRQRLGLDGLTDDPGVLTAAARSFLRDAFLRTRVAVSGANFGCADTGSVVVVESEGNGRMCTTLPEVLVTVMGIEKVVPAFRDLEVMLQLLPRSSTGERMNPYTSIWSGVHHGRRSAGVPPRSPRQRPHARARRRGGARRSPLHPLLGVHQRLPRLSPDGWARLPHAVCRADRRDPPATARRRAWRVRVAPVRIDSLRRLRRCLSGADRHPRAARPRAREGGGREAAGS